MALHWYTFMHTHFVCFLRNIMRPSATLCNRYFLCVDTIWNIFPFFTFNDKNCYMLT